MNSGEDGPGGSDRTDVRQIVLQREPGQSGSIPWAMRMKAASVEDPARLVQILTGAILGCGGWVLSRGSSDDGTVNMLFEFERHACVDLYCVLVAAGLELSQNGHRRFTELCQCTRTSHQDCGHDIVSIDLEIETFPLDILQGSSATELA